MKSKTSMGRELCTLFSKNNVLTDPADCWPYGSDNSRVHALPEAVVFGTDTDSIIRLVEFCSRTGVPLVIRGRGTGTTGAAVPVRRGIVLSMERMQKILEISPENRLLRTQSGATNQAIQSAAANHGFFWAPDPTSSAFCTVGGNLACNAAGPRAVKYGTSRENTLGLTAVTGAGKVIHTGVRTSKGVVGYDLTRLLIGSEGTLAVITEATLKLIPIPEEKRLLQAHFQNIQEATEAIFAIMAQPSTPCALEFMDKEAINMIREYSNVTLPSNAEALLLIELDGSKEQIEFSTTAIKKCLQHANCLLVDEARTDEESAQLWRTRKALSPALRKLAPKKINEDVVVPVSNIPSLIEGLYALGQHYNIQIVNFGHAGNGNIHVNLLVDPDDSKKMDSVEACLKDIFSLVLRLNGTLSGEHGIGLVKRDYVSQELDQASIGIMHSIKQIFDPSGILNPEKTLPLIYP